MGSGFGRSFAGKQYLRMATYWTWGILLIRIAYQNCGSHSPGDCTYQITDGDLKSLRMGREAVVFNATNDWI